MGDAKTVPYVPLSGHRFQREVAGLMAATEQASLPLATVVPARTTGGE